MPNICMLVFILIDMSLTTDGTPQPRPVRYDYSKVNADYPDHAVAGAIIYRLREVRTLHGYNIILHERS